MHSADRAFIAETTAKMLLEVKAVLFSEDKPFIFTSGWASPVYIDCRKLIFYPRIRAQLIDFAVATLARDAGLRAVRRRRGRRDRRHSLRRLDGRPARPADAVHPQEAEGLRPQCADRGRHPRGRAHAAGGGPDHRRALQDQFLQGAARGGRGGRSRVRQLLLRHLPRVEEGDERPWRAPALPRHLVGRAARGEAGQLPSRRADRRSGEIPRRARPNGRRRTAAFPAFLRLEGRHPQRQRHSVGGRKGLFRWLAAQKADVVCLQEIKAQEADLDGAQFSHQGLPSGTFTPRRRKATPASRSTAAASRTPW